jgi:hypothetical protein
MNNLPHASEEGIFIVKIGPQKWNFEESAQHTCKTSNFNWILKGKMQ